MSKALETKMESAIRTAALKEFKDDFECLGDLVRDSFDTVRMKLGYMNAAGTPIDEIYEATRKPLMAVRLMIATGKEPQDQLYIHKNSLIPEQIRLDRKIREFANKYLDRAEAEFAESMLEVETVETRIAASLTNPVWSDYLLEVKYAPIGMKMLGFQLMALGPEHQHCLLCGNHKQVEGYQLKAEKFSYIRWRCTNPGCINSGSIQSEQVAL